MPHRTPRTTELLSLSLQEGELVLWSECNGRGGKNALETGIFCAVAFFGIYGGFAYWAHTDCSISPQLMKITEFFIVFGLLSLISGFYYAAAEKRRLYAITNRRALIITPLPLAKPLLCAIPLTAGLIFSIKHRANNTADYLMYCTRYSKNYQDQDGFRNICDTQGLETTLKHLGIALPPPGKPVTAAFNKKPLFTPGSKALLLIAAFYIVLGIFLPVTIHSTGADLYLHGERATATIIGSKRRTQQEGKFNHTVTRHYPILAYRDTTLGPVRVTDTHGDESPTWHYGQQVDVLYTPGDTTRLIRDTQDYHRNATLFLGLIAMATLWLLWETAKTIRQARRTRHLPYLSEPISPAT